MTGLSKKRIAAIKTKTRKSRKDRRAKTIKRHKEEKEMLKKMKKYSRSNPSKRKSNGLKKMMTRIKSIFTSSRKVMPLGGGKKNKTNKKSKKKRKKGKTMKKKC